MTEEPAPRAPHAPHATQTPAPARGEGPESDRPPQGHTAPRPIDWTAIARTLRDAVKRAQRPDPEECEPHA